MQHSQESNRIEFLSEFESIFKTALALKSGHLGVPFNEKNWGYKISWDCPFKGVIARSQHIFAHFSENSQPYAKIFKPIDQWTKRDWFMKKTEG
jgi:hypothetical protein